MRLRVLINWKISCNLYINKHHTLKEAFDEVAGVGSGGADVVAATTLILLIHASICMVELQKHNSLSLKMSRK